MKPIFLFLLTLTIVLMATGLLIAQPGLPATPSQSPIDGGLALLAVAGGGYAIRKWINNRKVV